MELWAIVRGKRQAGTPIPPAVVVVGALVFVVSVAFWRAVFIETDYMVASQIDYEDAALCSKFGFPVGTAKHDDCKFDLLDLRHRHEDFITQTSFP